jgi:glycosyltransferase involved in cell wall biosynthesis
MHRPDRAPGQRYRFEQYLPDLRAAGYECVISHLLDERDDRIFYGKGKWLQKAGIVRRSFLKRLRERKELETFDIIFIYREALMIGSAFFERAAARSSARVILDFDDAIWLNDTSPNNRLFRFLKRPYKTADLISLADTVIVGNEFLAEYSRIRNLNTVVIPTTMDMEEYSRPLDRYDREPVVIGWTGSPTTIRHFRNAEHVLARLKERYGDRVDFRVIGDPGYRNEQLEISGIAWNPQDEVSELRQFDIGIMPLPDDEWSRGKCACKALQYMALGIPAVISAVGANAEVVCHGENGMLARSDEEFFAHLCALVDSAELRQQIGRAGRVTVEERYSRQAWRSTYLSVFGSR